MHDLTEALAAEGYEFFTTVEDDSLSYEWNEARVFLKDNRVFYLQEAGCSCNYWGDYYSTAEEAIGDMTELPTLNAARELIGQYHDSTAPAYHDYVEDFRKVGLR